MKQLDLETDFRWPAEPEEIFDDDPEYLWPCPACNHVRNDMRDQCPGGEIIEWWKRHADGEPLPALSLDAHDALAIARQEHPEAFPPSHDNIPFGPCH